MRLRSMLLCVLLYASITGCSTIGNVASKTAQVWAHPSIDVGPVADRPTQISLSIYASDSANPGDATTPAAEPIHVEIAAASPEALTGKLRDMLIAMGGKVEFPPELAIAAIPFTPSPPLPPLPESMPTDASGTAWLSLATAREWSGGVEPGEPVAPDALDAATASEDVPGAALALGQYRKATDATSTQNVAAEAAVPAGSPVHIRVLQLKDDSMLLAADFASLNADLKKALGSTYISDDDYVVTPGSFRFVDFVPVDSRTHFIAVLAAFRDLDGGTWKTITRIEPSGRRYPLQVVLTGKRVRILTEHS